VANARTLGQKAGQAVAYHHRPHQGLAYFGGKEGLFLAATKPKLDLDAVLAGGIDGFGRRLAGQMVDGWEQGDDPLLALRRLASSRPAALEALGEFLEHEATAPLARALIAWGCTGAEASGRANAIQSVLLGTLITRRMLETGAVAAATADELREWLADVLQRLVEDGSPAGLRRVSAASANT
jgi:hypothetical protein